MHLPMKHLFIGGFADGQWIEVPEEYEFYKVDAYRFADKKDYDFWRNKAIEIHNYRRQKWCSGPIVRHIFIQTSLEPNDILDILLKGYKCTTSTPSNTPRKTTSSGSNSA